MPESPMNRIIKLWLEELEKDAQFMKEHLSEDIFSNTITPKKLDTNWDLELKILVEEVRG